MTKVTSFIKTIKSKVMDRNGSLPQPGLYHYEFNEDGAQSRIHLRIDPDGNGLLLVNASRIIHLNPTAAHMAYFILQKNDRNQARSYLTKAYEVPQAQVYNDYTQIADKINELIKPNGACPIHDLDVDILPPFSSKPSAPYRMDLAVTYRCNNDCAHCYNARPRDFPALSTSDWYSILDKVWEIGIPHVVFTGGEPTLRKDLPE